MILKKLKELRKKINYDLISCKYFVGHVSLDDKDKQTLDMIKGLKPFQIDWSNIADYFTNKDFIKMVKKCSVEETAHVAHFMNW
jgi:hypothetical protein